MIIVILHVYSNLSIFLILEKYWLDISLKFLI